MLADVAPYVAGVISIVIAVIADRRARKAQREQHEVDRAKLINEAYQGIMDELREELKRLSDARVSDQEEYLERIRQLEKELDDEVERREEFEERLSQERDKTEALEQRLWNLEQRLARVRRKYGINLDDDGKQGDNGGDTNGNEETA